MRPKLIPAVLAFAACGAVALTGIASAGEAAETKVTIKVEGRDFSGTVKSPKPNRCAKDRKVTLFKQKGGEQGGGDDIKVASDNAELQGDRYRWNTGNTGQSGKFYARARKIEGCKADNSRTLHTED